MKQATLTTARAEPTSLIAWSGASHHRVALLVLLLAGAATASPVRAQPVAQDTAATGAQFTIGAAAAYAPRYEGSDEYKLQALPLVSYRNGRFFAGTLGGIGYDFSRTPDLQFGPVLSYRPGRDEDDSDRLRGLGDVDGGADIGAFVRWNPKPFFVQATLKHGVGGDVRGTQLRLGAGYGFTLSPVDRVVVDASVDWADEKVMQAYFGVNSAQSARSGLARYEASSGVRRYGVGATWSHAFSRQWFSTVGAGVYRLGEQAANSPITADRNGAVVSVGVGYRF